MRVDAKKVREQILTILDKKGLSGDELAMMANIDKSTVYRILNLKNKTVDRSTIRRIAEALKCDFIINGNNVKLIERKENNDIIRGEERNELRLKENDSIEKKLGRVVKMLLKMDAETMDIALSFVGLLAELEKSDLTTLAKARKILYDTGNKNEWLERMKAFVTLVGPLVDKDVYEKS